MRAYNKKLYILVLFLLYGSMSLSTISANDVTFQADVRNWQAIGEVTESNSIYAINEATIDGNPYQIQTFLDVDKDHIIPQVNSYIKNMTTKESIRFGQEMDHSHVYYRVKDAPYQEVTCDPNNIYYQIENNDGYQVLKKMYNQTSLGCAITLLTKVSHSGEIIHTIEVSNLTDKPLSDINFLVTYDVSVNDSSNADIYGNGDRGVYAAMDTIHLFAKPLQNIDSLYIGERDITNNLEIKGISMNDAKEEFMGKKKDAALYFCSETKDIQPGQVFAFSYQEQIFSGSLDSRVVIAYVDENNKPLTGTKVITGRYGDPYTTHPIQFEDYEFIKTEGKRQGNLSGQPKKVVYRYASTLDVPKSDPRDTWRRYCIVTILIVACTLLVYRVTKIKSV